MREKLMGQITYQDYKKSNNVTNLLVSFMRDSTVLHLHSSKSNTHELSV